MDLAGYPRTTKTAEDILDEPSAMATRNAISAGREVLDRTGLEKKEQLEVAANTGDMFILPPKTSNDVSE